ncbi:MAG: hypothetical protein WCG05_05650 [Alphaproteobacteria bacterium]
MKKLNILALILSGALMGNQDSMSAARDYDPFGRDGAAQSAGFTSLEQLADAARRAGPDVYAEFLQLTDFITNLDDLVRAMELPPPLPVQHLRPAELDDNDDGDEAQPAEPRSDEDEDEDEDDYNSPEARRVREEQAAAEYQQRQREHEARAEQDRQEALRREQEAAAAQLVHELEQIRIVTEQARTAENQAIATGVYNYGNPNTTMQAVKTVFFSLSEKLNALKMFGATLLGHILELNEFGCLDGDVVNRIKTTYETGLASAKNPGWFTDANHPGQFASHRKVLENILEKHISAYQEIYKPLLDQFNHLAQRALSFQAALESSGYVNKIPVKATGDDEYPRTIPQGKEAEVLSFWNALEELRYRVETRQQELRFLQMTHENLKGSVMSYLIGLVHPKAKRAVVQTDVKTLTINEPYMSLLQRYAGGQEARDLEQEVLAILPSKSISPVVRFLNLKDAEPAPVVAPEPVYIPQRVVRQEEFFTAADLAILDTDIDKIARAGGHQWGAAEGIMAYGDGRFTDFSKQLYLILERQLSTRGFYPDKDPGDLPNQWISNWEFNRICPISSEGKLRIIPREETTMAVNQFLKPWIESLAQRGIIPPDRLAELNVGLDYNLSLVNGYGTLQFRNFLTTLWLIRTLDSSLKSHPDQALQQNWSTLIMQASEYIAENTHCAAGSEGRSLLLRLQLLKFLKEFMPTKEIVTYK